MLLKANVLTVKEGTYKYEKVEDRRKPFGDRLE